MKDTLKSAFITMVSFFTWISIGTAQEITLKLDASEPIAEIQPTMYGIFFEDINFAADGGLYAEMIKNRSFEFFLPKTGWSEPNSNRHSLNLESGIASTVKYSEQGSNHNFCRVQVRKDTGYELINEGFRGMGIKQGEKYRLSLLAAKGEGAIRKINFTFIDAEGNPKGTASVIPTGPDWEQYEAMLIATETVEKARFKITFEGNGTIDLDMVSLFPEDTWKGRKNGLRKDLVQLLCDLDPGFLRFPGGCIVEGRTLAQRYQWKKTIGPVADREILNNRWNTEFSHRPAPDYFQSFGLGFFEYFQLAEDLGAEPLPILGCGMACQFNTGELVPLEDLDPYVQDALDLIEFANGDMATTWGKLRHEMGHPEPFKMKYIGIGNEQWGPEYIERYKVFAAAIKEKHPEIIIVSGSGPFPEGDYFEYGMEALKKLNAEIIDEHYYNSPEWFLENADRYDSYDRNGPKIFAGEYAAQSVAIASPLNQNNWNCALSEAAFMTGLERNADVVHLSSYAPLMAHADGWQWTPDLIWFNNLSAYGTPNYYVQKLFATNRGTDLLSITLDGKPLTGQQQLYASGVLDKENNQLILKLVNVSEEPKNVILDVAGRRITGDASMIVLRSDAPEAVNSFGIPENITPEENQFTLKLRDEPGIEIPSLSFVVVKLNIR